MRRWFLLGLLWLTTSAIAGQSCEEYQASPDNLRKAFALALKVRNALDSSGAQVALVARVGQDLSKYRLRYSHIAFLWRDHPAGPWLAVHLLNECGTGTSTLYTQGLANFFADDIYAWDALIAIPSERIQQGIAARLANNSASYLHEPKYNMVAYPYSGLYQNSNQWVLEVLAETLADTNFIGRSEAQSWLQENAYRPTTLEISALTRLGARMFRANVAFDDHPMDRRMAGQIDTVTVESMVTFLRRSDSQFRQQIVRLP